MLDRAAKDGRYAIAIFQSMIFRKPKSNQLVNFYSYLKLFVLGTGVNFTTIPKAQKDSQVKQLFALFGSACVKAVSKHVDEIDPRVLTAHLEKLHICETTNQSLPPVNSTQVLNTAKPDL